MDPTLSGLRWTCLVSESILLWTPFQDLFIPFARDTFLLALHAGRFRLITLQTLFLAIFATWDEDQRLLHRRHRNQDKLTVLQEYIPSRLFVCLGFAVALSARADALRAFEVADTLFLELALIET